MAVNVPVALGGRSYEVVVGEGLLAKLDEYCGPFLSRDNVPIISDDNVAERWRAPVETALSVAGKTARWMILPAGESSKSWSTLERVVDWLLAEGIERGDNVLALGGGVIGDLTGFACAITKRGCGFIQLPTSLLAQVDSSVGGKTAINTKAGKNLVGAFHQPSLVLADIGALATLPARELRCGFAEIIKYGILGDADFFTWCRDNSAAVLGGDAAAQQYAVTSSVRAKALIVAEDERETSGKRALLNLGHTFGHALEAETGYSERLLHGEAVALGMVLAARYSVRRGELDESSAEHIAEAIDAAGLPAELSALGLECSGTDLTHHMLHDKKMDSGTLPFILLRAIGEAYLARDVQLSDVAAFLDEQISG